MITSCHHTLATETMTNHRLATMPLRGLINIENSLRGEAARVTREAEYARIRKQIDRVRTYRTRKDI